MRISSPESFIRRLELIEVERNRWNKLQASSVGGFSLCIWLGGEVQRDRAMASP